ncbi:hypothetical protein ARMGADRAFT_1022933 [Armillaria gallica]|uniref:Uncharacterized protein n=1 Tax=Armillaria gallica TaxID=47427 RepID=A0A2H3EAU8_ARMGA|nr:hypothetical protein ARMGADRAFT_1022933 [Armillaria gallica]
MSSPTREWDQTWTMATILYSSSYKYFLSRQEPTPEPRNATPGPSNVCRTLTPDATPAEQNVWTTVLDRPTDVAPEPSDKYPMGTWGPEDTSEHLWVWDQPMAPNPAPSFTATNLGLEPEVITICNTDSGPVPILRTPTQVVIPHPDRATMGIQASRPNLMLRTATPVPQTFSPTDSESFGERTPTLLESTIMGTPAETVIHLTSKETTMTGQTSQSLTEPSLDQNRPLPGISGGRTSSNNLTGIADERESQWDTSLLLSKGIPSSEEPEGSRTRSWPEYMRIGTGRYTAQQQETGYETYNKGRQKNRGHWRMPSDCGQNSTMLNYRQRNKEAFNSFQLDEGMFRPAI